MVKGLILGGMMIVLSAGGAYAQLLPTDRAAPPQGTAEQQDESGNPCRRGQSMVKMAGVDLDTMRCQIYLSAGKFAELESNQLATMAQLVMVQSDLKTAERRAGSMAEYWRAYVAGLSGDKAQATPNDPPQRLVAPHSAPQAPQDAAPR